CKAAASTDQVPNATFGPASAICARGVSPWAGQGEGSPGSERAGVFLVGEAVVWAKQWLSASAIARCGDAKARWANPLLLSRATTSDRSLEGPWTDIGPQDSLPTLWP